MTEYKRAEIIYIKDDIVQIRLVDGIEKQINSEDPIEYEILNTYELTAKSSNPNVELMSTGYIVTEVKHLGKDMFQLICSNIYISKIIQLKVILIDELGYKLSTYV